MSQPIRRVNRIVDELVRRGLVNPPRYENGNIREPVLVAEIYRRIQEPQHIETREAGDQLFWTKHIQSRVKYVTQHTKGQAEVSEEYITELQNLAEAGNNSASTLLYRYRHDKFRKYQRVPQGDNTYALKEHEDVLVEENRRIKGQYRKRRVENGRYEKYHGDIDTIAELLGLDDKEQIGQILQILSSNGGPDAIDGDAGPLPH